MPDYDPMTAYLYGTFVEIAYQMYNSDPNNLTPAVPPNFPKNYQLVLYLDGVDSIEFESEMKFFGFIAQSTRQPSEYVAAIRGTSNIIEWIIDAEFLPTKFTPIPEAGDVEDGFFSIYKTLTGALPNKQPQQVHQFIRDNIVNGYLTCVGHSLGSSIATMLALESKVNDGVSNTTLYTFASPKTGDGTFARYFDSHVLDSLRIYNEPDIVPKLPPLYSQVNTAYEIDSKNFSNIKHSILCYHELTTYLWVINQQSEFGLGDCQK
ncbi:MAG: lipase family protein [Acidobacteriota bacterium]